MDPSLNSVIVTFGFVPALPPTNNPSSTVILGWFPGAPK